MKKTLILSLSALILAGCGNTNQPAANTNTASQTTNVTTPLTAQKNDNSLVISSHQSEKKPASSSTDLSSEQSSPNQQAIDVSDVTAKIETGEKEYKAKPNDPKIKAALAQSYFERAFLLTKAAQYRAALGDFRKGLKLDPNDKEAKDMHDQIISIFESIGRTPPKEGEEPTPLPFKKDETKPN